MSDTPPPCPACASPMVKRTGKTGEFWGCTEFRNGCRGTRKIDMTSPARSFRPMPGPAPRALAPTAGPRTTAPPDRSLEMVADLLERWHPEVAGMLEEPF